MPGIDFDTLRGELCDRFPPWTAWIERLEITEAAIPRPSDNNGQCLLVNSRLLSYLAPENQRFCLARELVHLRLHHDSRGQGKDRSVWRRACDAVVNGMLREEGFRLPDDARLPPADGEYSADALYEKWLKETPSPSEQEDENPDDPRTRPEHPPHPQAGNSSSGARREIEDPGIAAAVSGLSELLEPSLQLDFDWFPGDKIRDGMLPYRFRAYPVAHAEILLDTSASVDADLLRAFVRGVKALLREDAVIRVGCFDTAFYGFCEIRSDADIDALQLQGAGGTNFEVAVNAFTGDAENRIIFTDGYAEMPQQRCDALWVVYGNSRIQPPGGRVIYAKVPEEREKHEISFLIT